MIAFLFEQKISKPFKLRERLVENLKIYLVIKPLQYIFKSEAKIKLYKMSVLPDGTLGKDTFNMLDKNNLNIIPKFEHHDMKHLILGYGTSSIDEIRMQAYLFGNGNHDIFCSLFLVSGILFPEYWTTFYRDYKKGKNSPSMLNLSIDDCMTRSTGSLKKKYNKR